MLGGAKTRVPSLFDKPVEVKKEPVLGWFGEHQQLEMDTRDLREDQRDEPDAEKKEETALENPEVIAARERRQRIAMALNKPSTDQLRRTFADFDLNSDGKLDISEVKRLLKAGKPTMTESEIEFIFKKVDKNCDSRISFNELVSWVFSSDGPSEETQRIFR
eukprot:symbB.v1.2.006765.t1/scaffold369.1/size218568/3